MQELLFHDLQNLHGASLDTNATSNALGGGILGLQNHDLHGADSHTGAAADALLLVDHVDAGLGVLGNSLMLAGLHTLTALNAGHGLRRITLGNDTDARQVFVKFLIECFGASLNALQTSHTLLIFLNSELLHGKNSPFLIFSISIIHIISKKSTVKYKFRQTDFTSVNALNRVIISLYPDKKEEKT
jgi:hypothetical protein